MFSVTFSTSYVHWLHLRTYSSDIWLRFLPSIVRLSSRSSPLLPGSRSPRWKANSWRASTRIKRHSRRFLISTKGHHREETEFRSKYVIKAVNGVVTVTAWNVIDCQWNRPENALFRKRAGAIPLPTSSQKLILITLSIFTREASSSS